MFWLNGCFGDSFFKKNVNGTTGSSAASEDYTNSTSQTNKSVSSNTNKCFEKNTSESDSYDTFVNYNDGARCSVSTLWSDCDFGSNIFNGIFNGIFGWHNSATTYATYEEGGSVCDKPSWGDDSNSATTAVKEEGGSSSSDDSTNVTKTLGESGGDSDPNDGIMTLAMLEEGGSSLDGQISTKAMYEEGGSDSDKPSLGDKPFWGHHHWGHHHWGGGAVTLAMLECGGSTDGAQDVKPPSSDNDTDIPSVDDNNGSCEEQPEVDKPQDDFPELTLPDDNDFGSINATTFIAYEDGGQ